MAAPPPLSCLGGSWLARATPPSGIPRGAGRDFVGKYYVAFGSTGFASYDSSGDSWTTEVGLPFTAGGRGGITADGLTKVVAFFSDGAGTAVTQKYHISGSSSWESPVTPMPTPRTNFAFIVGVGGIHLIGGHDDLGATESTAHEVYTMGTDSWSTKAAIDIAIGNASGALGPSGDIYVWGNAAGSDVGRVWRRLADTWEPLPAPPWAGRGATDLVVATLFENGGFVFLIGGGNGGGDPTRFWTYDPLREFYCPTGSASSTLTMSETNLANTEVYAFGSSDAEKFIC